MHNNMINEQDDRAKNSSWWKRRTRLEKWFMLAILILLLLVLMILPIKFINIPSFKENSRDDLCITPSCIQTASSILDKMDLNVDPCDDFYTFACGKFVRNTVVPEYKSEISSFNIVGDMVEEQMRTLLEKPIKEDDSRPFVLVKSIYQACMNTTQIEAKSLDDIKQTIKSTGGWPVVDGDQWKENSFNWEQTVYKFMELGLSNDIFFDFDVTTDLVNSSKRSLTLDQPLVVSFDKTMRIGFNESLVQSYYDYIVKLAIAFGADPKRASREMEEVLKLDIEIIRITLPEEERRNSSLEYNPMTIQQLQSEYPYVRWLQYINKKLHPIKKMNNDDVVVVTIPIFFKKLEKIIKSTPKRTLSNYMHWKAIKELITYLNNDLRKLRLEFSKIISGTSKQAPRWKECTQEAITLDIAAGALYVKNFFEKEAKETMLELVENIRHQFILILSKVDWMDKVTKEKAIDKAKVMTIHIGYPDEILDDKKLDDYYKNLTVDRFNYFKTIRNVTIYTNHMVFAELDKIVDKKDWRNHADATTVNAFYDQSENSIDFPAGILQGVFFSKNRPQYMNYGAIGYVIGHEVTHGFDDIGRQFDKDGNVIDWWQNHTEEAFNKKAQCIIDQYSSFLVPKINLTLNGINTQGENIADNGGIKQAYLAYKKWTKDHGREQQLPGLPYTPEQMFWISAGSMWCGVDRTEQLKIDVQSNFHVPSYYRVNVPFMNSEFFSKDYNCPIGSKMNPKEKCHVW